MSEKFEHDIKKSYGKIERGGDSWPLEVNLVSWNGRPPKVDIRCWTPDGKPRKGITLTEHEATVLREILSRV